MKKYIFIFVFTIIVTLCVFIPLVVSSINNLTAKVPEKATSGKKIWQKNGCVECHTVLGNGGYRGPDLTRVVSKRGSTWVMNFLQKGPVMRPAKKSTHQVLKNNEASEIISYLKFINGIQTPEYLPKPR